MKLLQLTEAQETKETGFHTNIEKETVDNTDYRRVLFTTAPNTQLVVMNLKPGEEIGSEVHKDTAQFLRFESGKGKCVINEKEYTVNDGDSVIIPAGSEHNVINTSSSENLKLYSLYSPPVHKDGLVEKIKSE